MSPPLDNKRAKGWNFLLALFFLLLIQRPALAQTTPPLDDSSLFREGEIFLSKGDNERALWRFKRLLTEFPQSPLLNEAKFRMGICYTQLKRPKDALRILQELLTTFLAPARMIQVFTLMGDNCFELKDPMNSLRWYGKAILVPGQPNDELKKKVRSMIDSFNSEEELNQIDSLYRGAYAGGYAKLKLAQMAKRQGNDALARKILLDLDKEYRGVDYGLSLKELSESLPLPPKSKYTLGVILPLSGVFQPFGERVLQGMELAIKESENSDKIPLISLAIRDSKGSPLEAEKAVEELVNKERVLAILGPLLSVTTDKAAQKAQQMEVPIFTFSQKELSLGNTDFIYQNSLTPSEQIQTLVEYAIKDLELQTFAIFYPNSPYGLQFKNLFIQEVSQRGGKISGVVVYQEDQTDFYQEIKEFFKVKIIQKYNSGLFIPDAHDRAGAILSQIASFDIKGITFLGTSAWNGPGLISIGGKGAEGAIFIDAFFKRSSSPRIVYFAREFQKTYQRDPEILEALGYDGVKFIKDLLQSRLISSSIQLKEEIRQVQDFQGVSGLKGFDEGGKAIRTLSILKVNKGQIEQVVP
jgi:ABC-type branched-subunit amino acid transport system substrate-binding protein